MSSNDVCGGGEIRELTSTLKSLMVEVKDLTSEMRELKEKQLPELLISHGVHGEKISRLEMLIYSAIGGIFLEGIAMISGLIVFLVTR